MAKAKPIEGYDVSQSDFINEYTRFLLATIWAPNYITKGVLWGSAGTPFAVQNEMFLEHARRRGWISKKEDKVLGLGYGAAAAFHRR